VRGPRFEGLAQARRAERNKRRLLNNNRAWLRKRGKVLNSATKSTYREKRGCTQQLASKMKVEGLVDSGGVKNVGVVATPKNERNPRKKSGNQLQSTNSRIRGETEEEPTNGEAANEILRVPLL